MSAVSAVSRLMVSGMSRTLRSLWSGHGPVRHPDIGEGSDTSAHKPQSDHPMFQRPVISHGKSKKHNSDQKFSLSESIGFNIVVMSTTLDVFQLHLITWSECSNFHS